MCVDPKQCGAHADTRKQIKELCDEYRALSDDIKRLRTDIEELKEIKDIIHAIHKSCSRKGMFYKILMKIGFGGIM